MPATPSSRPETCVGAVVVEQGHLLLIRRGRGAGRGLWSVPGGRVEWGETLAQALEREVAEETGLTVACGAFVGWVELVGADHHYVILDFLAGLATDDRSLPTPRAGDDADAAAWVPLDEISALPLVDGLYRFLADHGVVGQA